MSDTKNENRKGLVDEDIKLSPEILEKIRDIDMDYDLGVSLFKILTMEESRLKLRNSSGSPRYKEGIYKLSDDLKDRKSEEI